VEIIVLPFEEKTKRKSLYGLELVGSILILPKIHYLYLYVHLYRWLLILNFC